MKLFRLFLTLLNLIFIIAGIATLVIAIYMIHDGELQQLRPLLNPNIKPNDITFLSNFEILAIVLALIGGTLLTLGLIGELHLNCSELKRAFLFNFPSGIGERIRGCHCLHLLYATILAGIILAEVIFAIIYFVYQYHWKSKLIDHLSNSIALYYVGRSSSTTMPVNSISLAWDFTQYHLQCCGAVSQQDYGHAHRWNRTDPYGSKQMLVIPYTCCPIGVMENLNTIPKNLPEALACATTGINAYTIGCYDRLIDMLSKYRTCFIASIVVILVMELFALLLCIYVYRRRKLYNTL